MMAPSILSTKDIETIKKSSRAPMSPVDSPFLNCSIDEIYEFFLDNVRPLGGEISGAWTAHTFIVLDERTVADKTCLICCDAPDFLEEERVVLKKIRSDFLMSLSETLCYETFTRCPSESGDGRLLETGEVLTQEAVDRGEREGHAIMSVAPSPWSGRERRAAISFGVTNETGRKREEKDEDGDEEKDEDEDEEKDEDEDEEKDEEKEE
jgi:hypothetical protein